MKSFEHIYRLHRLLRRSRYPVSFGRIEQELECSRSSVKRLLKDMREQLGAPIQTCRDPAGYRYADDSYELPGLWFGAAALKNGIGHGKVTGLGLSSVLPIAV